MFCKNNWIDISWDGKPIRTGPEDISLKINCRANELIPFDQACDQVAKDIAAKHENLFVSLSGGSDSEYVASCFHRNNIPFTVLMINYDHELNPSQHYERWFARQWCKKHNVVPLEVNVGVMIETQQDHALFPKIKPRLPKALTTQRILLELCDKHRASLVTGMQLEYYPDLDQMAYLEPWLGDYQGFVFEETDFYIETMIPNGHPWAFYYWTPEVMASFVHAWNIDLNMQQNKSQIYNTSLRPKFPYTGEFYSYKTWKCRNLFSQKYGTRDCALLGTRSALLQKLMA